MQLNVTKLKNSETVNDLQSAVNRKLSNLPTPSNDIEEAWASFGDAVHSVAFKVLGRPPGSTTTGSRKMTL